MGKKCYMLDVAFDAKNIQRFMYWVSDAWRRGGGCMFKFRSPRILGRLAGRICACFTTGIRKSRLVVLCDWRADSYSWPWCYFFEIVPLIWDLWPSGVPAFVRFVKRNHVKTVFVTASRQVARLKDLLPGVRIEWMPEAIDVASYPNGCPLARRKYDVIEYGRRKKDVHADLVTHRFGRSFNHLYSRERVMFPRFEDMTAAIRGAKLSICYPQIDTAPERVGDVETLTQRYWEAMASGTLVAGRAPQELIDLCGYNPVITLGKHPAEQIEQVLNEIDQGDWQDLADRNRAFVEQHADWSVRIKEMKRVLEET